MKVFIVVSSLLAVVAAAPHVLTYTAIPATTYIAAAPAEVTNQFHAQDELGQYSYGYSGGLSAKTETKSLDGVTRGSYTFLDAENKVQTVSYTADDVNGFRAEASNMPVAPVESRAAPEPVQDTLEVAQAKNEHLAAVEEIKARNAAVESTNSVETATVVEAAPVAAIAPVSTYNAVPVQAVALAAPAARFSYSTSTVALKPQPIAVTTYAAPIPVAAPASFAYSTYTQNIPTAIQYSAAPAASYAVNLQAPGYAYAYNAPTYYTTANVAPVVLDARAAPVAVPEPVQDTPEVAQAKAEHLQAVAEVKARNLQ
ncbi:cuticle protein 19.8-like [Sabethes cyaneus]|uniref:cuticle protein 19.8-like n=1 Tax=Sabethes cyaneus TaxID=53552 RepID=UPI00237DAD83|nr:cuticle protein 19.8-like [Sabethes cyaneus]